MRYTDNDLDVWVREGLVSAEQAAAIRSRTADRASSERRDRVVSTLAVIGAVVGGLGVILFFAANWDAIPRPTRVILLLATVVGAYVGGDFLRARRPAVGQALLLLGALSFGASLFLVGQMYHVQAHDPLAFLVWTAVAVPTAIVARARPIAALSLLTSGGWIVFELVEQRGGGGDLFEYVPVVAVLYGAGLDGWGTWLRDDLYRAPMRVLGYAFAVIGAFVFTFRASAEELGTRTALNGFESFGLAALAGAALAGCVLLWTRRERSTAALEAAALAGLVVLQLAAVLVPERTDLIAYPILFNVVVAALALGAIAVGYANDEVWLVNSGIALVAIDVFARYVDVFWDLLPRSLGFLGAGVLLLALAFGLERQRGRLVRRLEAGT
jgi:uncharacterized membrane protein